MTQKELSFNPDSIREIQEKLNNHHVYQMIDSIETLQLFMEHHIFSVWDFMSLVKFLQNAIAPARSPWGLHSSRQSRRFINSIVLEEESDLGLPDKDGNPTYASHFEMYAEAMKEIGANAETGLRFSEAVTKFGFTPAIELSNIPVPSKVFMETTFRFIDTGKPHLVAAAFALGREKIIPDMFRQILRKMEVPQNKTPAFTYYLERHIHLDEDFHAPLSIAMLNELCDSDPEKIKEAQQTAIAAIEARIKFWDGVALALSNQKKQVA